MLTSSKFALIAALCSARRFRASAATKVAAEANQGASQSDVIPGYGKDGGHVAVPNPDR